MNGNEIYENNFKNKIDNLIISNPDKSYLKGFSNFIENSGSTKYNYINYIIDFTNYINKKVEDICVDDYTDFLSSIKDKSSSYRIAVYSALKKFSLYLKASRKNLNDDMQYVSRPKFIESEITKKKREIGYLTYEEIQQLLNSIDKGVGNYKSRARQKAWKSRDRLIVLIFLSTGMRCSALYKLNINSIDYNNNKLVVVDKGSKYKEYQLSNELMSYIDEWLIDREEYLDGKEEDALFISNRKTRMDQSSISDVVKKYASVIDGKHITPHKLRATYGTQLYEKTGDLYLVQECMGHSNPKTTELYIRGQKNQAAQTASEIMTKLIF